ncbi:MAG: hypothetical protein G01um101431_599 [Parcubacteria group bacterium Gr01-1014_31]|nr:MAG: hypothetical protein G01um101431_599 [Parcubacteria group bacterium Gr01-1014_31]
MFITSKVDLPVLQVVEQGEGDAKKAASLPGGVFPAGCHEVETIPNPVCRGGPCWMVLKGTKIGHAKEIWQRWRDKKRGDKAVLITEMPPIPPSVEPAPPTPEPA